MKTRYFLTSAIFFIIIGISYIRAQSNFQLMSLRYYDHLYGTNQTTFTYDNRERLLSETTRVNNTTTSEVTVSYIYNKHGQLIRKNFGNGVTENYTYNIQGWLKSKDAKRNSSNIFATTLRYYDKTKSATTARYNGNISEIEWQQVTQTEYKQTYGYTYDGIGRLINSARYEGTNSTADNAYTERDITYDKNGNITTLKRYGSTPSTINNNLNTATYTGNRLMSIKDGSTTIYNYAYDTNGNLTTDGRRNVTIEYNLLNLPKQVQDSSSTLLGTYNYLADGTKRAVVGSTEELDYLGSLIYKKSGNTRTLENILFSEGVINKSGSTYNRTYHIKDHLGSVRVVTDNTGNVLEKNDYYPFGLRIATTTETSNRYKFSGKEIQTIVSSTYNYLDFGARMYDPVIARWSTQDPMREKYYGIGQYVYVANNPVRLVDPDGLSYSEFDENGNYLRTTKDNWWHNTFVGRTGRIVDGNGSITQKFKFADPKNDVQNLKDGIINKVHFVQESEIISMLSKAGAFDYENKTANSDSRYEYISEQGKGYGKFDFAANMNIGIPAQYSDANQSLFLIDGVAHNHFNYGNFLFGAAGRALGLTSFELQMGAHYNSVFNSSTNGYKPQLDSWDDQFSIRMGVQHATKQGYKGMYYRVTVGPLQKQ